MCKTFLKITHQTALREVWSNTASFFSDVGLTKFVLGSELFVPRPYFICHLTAKRFAKDLVAGSSIYSSKKVVKTGIKWKIWNCTFLLWILAKELVGKRFFDLFAFYIDIKFHVKVISSLARVLQKVLGIGFFFIWFEINFLTSPWIRRIVIGWH